MKRFFTKGSKTEQGDKSSAEVNEEKEAEETDGMEDDKLKTENKHGQKTGKMAGPGGTGQGDADRTTSRKIRSSRRNVEEVEEKAHSEKVPVRKQNVGDRGISRTNTEDIESQDEKTTMEFIKPPRPLPRKSHGSTSLFSPSESEERERDDESKGQEIEDESSERPSKGKKATEKSKEAKKAAKKRGRSGAKPDSGSDTEGVQYVSIKDSKNMPKVEMTRGGHCFSSVYKYKQPISDFRIRARLLKYPSFTDKHLWSGEMAVVDERIFHWQEKVFSKSESKKFQKLENCLTDQERKYHDELSQSTATVGRYLHSYVNDDLFTAKKKMKLLIRRCPVPHIRNKEKSFPRVGLGTGSRLLISEGESFDLDTVGKGEDDLCSDDSIDFDEPISSSTPMQSRKSKNKGANEIAKAEKRMREKREKELKNLEKRNLKLKEMKIKKEKEEEKKRSQEKAKVMDKLKKLEAIESKEKELRVAYMKKYKYSKRPSMPLGARMRSVRLTPSPGKLERKKKSYTLSRSSEISDFQDDDVGSGPSIEDSKESSRRKSHEQSSKLIHTDSLMTSSKVGTEYYDSTNKYNIGRGLVYDSKRHGKINDRVNFKNAQTMYIMASIPYLQGRCREVVVCSILHIPNQQVLIFKPALGYRNVEAKRNDVFRISCEIYPSEKVKSQDLQHSLTEGKAKNYMTDTDIHGDLGFFEAIPKNEFRLSVMGEIATAHGFDTSPLCIYYAIDIPKGWRNDSLLSNTEGMTHTCFTNHHGFAHFSHEISFHLVFSMDFIDEVDSNRHFPTPVIALMAVSMNHPSPRIVYEGYGYVSIPMTPGSHSIKIRMWKPRPRTVLERMRATFLDISPSLQDMKLTHMACSDSEEFSKGNLIGLQTEPSGTVKLRLHVIHQSPSSNKDYESNLDLLEKMSSATILRSVQAVIQAFQRARQKAENLKSQYN